MKASWSDALVGGAPALFLILWSSGFAFAKLGLEHAEPLTFLALRYGLIVLLLGPVCLVARPPLPKRRVDWLHLAVVGFLIQAIYFGLAYLGMAAGVSAGVAAVIASMQPLLVALASPVLTREQIGLRRWLGLAAGAVGAIVVINDRTSLTFNSWEGVLLCVGSACGMASATLYQKRFGTKTHPVSGNLVQYGVGFVAVGTLALIFETGRVDWTGEFALVLGYLAIANSLVAVTLLLFMIARSEASRVSSLFFLVPPVAALMGWLMLGETLSAVMIAGMSIAALGVWLVTRPA